MDVMDVSLNTKFTYSGFSFGDFWPGLAKNKGPVGSISISPKEDKQVVQIILIFVPGGTDLKPNIDEAKQLWIYFPYEMMQLVNEKCKSGGGIFFSRGEFSLA